MGDQKPRDEQPANTELVDSSADKRDALVHRLRGLTRDAGTGSTDDLFADRRHEAELEAAREARYVECATQTDQFDGAAALEVPDDAGEHADCLRQILRRIPKRWDPRIRVDKGWYPLVCELDQALSALFPDYVVHQVKQKHAVLNYNWEEPDESAFSDPKDPQPETRDWAQYQDEMAGWRERQSAYRERVGLLDAYAEFRARVEQAKAVTAAAERKSMTICELCSTAGVPSHSDEAMPQTMILCDDCRADSIEGRTYLPAGDWEQKYGAPERPSYWPPRTGAA